MGKIKNHRKELQKRYGQLYHRVAGVDLYTCVYCGAPRQCLDHVPAISLLEGIDVKKYLEEGGKLLLYPSCLDCNGYLSNLNLLGLYERMDHIIQRLDKKLSKIEYWSPHELRRMGPNMKAYIQAHQYKIEILSAKIKAIDDRKLKLDEEGHLINDNPYGR